ncbi:IS630 transposase-related protein [Symbiopectobacterium sp. RP]|uniref:IS630 transposase-related protein n=1 Tax=Symbiopectobacterium sp. RP TaxID=3248553 RepID=UPI003D2DA7C9
MFYQNWLAKQHDSLLFNKAPDAYQKERAERFGVCQKAIWQALKKLGLTYKKTLPHPKADESARQAFQQKNNSMKKKVNLLFLREEQMLSALY